jgi:hypothetical protein
MRVRIKNTLYKIQIDRRFWVRLLRHSSDFVFPELLGQE